MESDNWVVQNLQNALETWNSKLTEIWQLLTQSPDTFKGGGHLECHHKYSRSLTGNWICIVGTVLCYRCSKDLRQLRRGENTLKIITKSIL